MPPDGAALDSVQSATVAAATPPVTTAAAPPRDLAPTSDPPWNPARPIPSRRPWEYVLVAPQRIATLPLTGFGRVLDHGLLWIENTSLIQRAFYVRAVPESVGIHPKSATFGDRTGLAARIEVRTPYLSGRLKNFVNFVHAVSIRHYHDTEVRLLGSSFALLGASSTEYGYTWRPRDRYYGLGMTSSEARITNYATQSEHLRFTVGHAWNKREENQKPRTVIMTWIGPRSIVTRSGRDEDKPTVEVRFPEDVANTLNRRFEHLVYGFRFASDWRLGVPHWKEGWRILIETERYDTPQKRFALHTTETGAQFTRTTLEFETGGSFFTDPRTIRVLGRMVDQGITSGRDRMLISDLSSLGGRLSLGGYQPERFHDVDLLFLRLSYIFPLVRRLEMDLHAESGAVFPDLWRDSRLDRFKQSYGMAMRIRSDVAPVASVGVEWSREAIRVRYSLGNPD